MNALSPRDASEAGFYWYLDTLGSTPQVVEVVGDDVLMVRFAGRADEDPLAELAGSLVGPLRPPGAQLALSETEQKAVQTALNHRGGRVPAVVKDPGEGHPS